MKRYLKADLHIHSNYSDGEYSPRQLIKLCAQKELDIVSLTDHDTIDGVPEMTQCAKEHNIICLSGIEFSTYSQAEIHILGYNFDIYNADFINEIKRIKQLRIQRVISIINKLKELGIEITQEEVFGHAKDSASVGRVHIAKALINKNIVSSTAEAFNTLLSAGKPAYVPSFRIDPLKAITLIKGAGGKAVLAHPFGININFTKLLPLICSLKEYGLDGIETQYYTHNSFETRFLTQTAKKLGLICTCGSDYHGSIRNSPIKAYNLQIKHYDKLIDK